MTKSEFNSLKVGDRCYLREKSGKYTSTEVRQIDRIFEKLVVLLHPKPVSYRCIQKKLAPHQKESGFAVGSWIVPGKTEASTVLIRIGEPSPIRGKIPNSPVLGDNFKY